MLKTYDECVKRGKYDELDELFDITKANGVWLSSEDKQPYYLQVESRGKVGYATCKEAGKETIYPSKRRKLPDKPCTSVSYDLSSNDSDKESDKSEVIESEYVNNDDDDDEYTSPPKRKHNKSKAAVYLVASARVSTRQAAKICKQLALGGINYSNTQSSWSL